MIALSPLFNRNMITYLNSKEYFALKTFSMVVSMLCFAMTAIVIVDLHKTSLRALTYC